MLFLNWITPVDTPKFTAHSSVICYIYPNIIQSCTWDDPVHTLHLLEKCLYRMDLTLCTIIRQPSHLSGRLDRSMPVASWYKILILGLPVNSPLYAVSHAVWAHCCTFFCHIRHRGTSVKILSCTVCQVINCWECVLFICASQVFLWWICNIYWIYFCYPILQNI